MMAIENRLLHEFLNYRHLQPPAFLDGPWGRRFELFGAQELASKKTHRENLFRNGLSKGQTSQRAATFKKNRRVM